MPVLNRYAAALLQIAIIVIGAFSAITPDSWGKGAGWGLLALALQAILTYLVPLLDKGWAGALKTGLPAVLAVLTLIIPLAQQGGAIDPAQISIFALAALNTLAAELGVQIRKDSKKLTLATQSPVDGSYDVTSTEADGTTAVG